MQICNSGGLDDDVPACLPDDMLQLNVSSEVSFVTLHPALRYPDIQNLRVEVAGQVLSRGGNVGADQLADTSATLTNRSSLCTAVIFSCLSSLSRVECKIRYQACISS